MLTQEQFIRNFSVMADGEVDFFLGAGASIASGIPTGSDLIWEFKRTLYCSECGISTAKYKDLALPSTRRILQEYREEIAGIMQAFSGIEVELIQVQEYCPWRGIRFDADPGPKAYGFAVKRGMAVRLDHDSFLLWTHGCVIHPELSATRNYYKGSRGIPAPLLIKRYVGKASGDTLAKEILMLTKMNWNSGDSLYKTLPVTLDFAKVLARMSKQEEAIFDKAYDFRFFM